MTQPQSSNSDIDLDQMQRDIEMWTRECLTTFRRGGFPAMGEFVNANPARAALVLGLMSRAMLSAAEEAIDEAMKTKENPSS